MKKAPKAAPKKAKETKPEPKKAAGKKKAAAKTLTKHHLAEIIAEKVGVPYQLVMQIVQLSFDEITATLLDGGRAEFRNFGVFSSVVRKSSIGRNPKKPQEEVVIPARKIVKFKPGKIMSDASKKTPTVPKKAKTTVNSKKKEK